jgi:hypothetical protein
MEREFGVRRTQLVIVRGEDEGDREFTRGIGGAI